MTLSRAKITNGHYSTSNGNGQNTVNNFVFECADCSSTNAQWASLNHGVLICDDCCLAHRSLGRCISIIKSLRKSYWPQSLIDTLYELVRSNSNHIWESNHHTNDGSSSLSKQLNLTLRNNKNKASSSKETRINYIRAKYENLHFISRGKYSSIEELNQQLLASIKTNNYENTLRILSQGADANYRNQEDGSLCIHTAVLHNQIGQIELLCLYGAEVTGLDRNGLTPYELAKLHNMSHIAERLIELQFELTDEISYFLCNKRPDHKGGQHFYIPDLTDTLVPCQEESTKNAMLKIQELPDHLFEELSKDIYDELDRRQIETIWKCTVTSNLVNEPIPFLVIKSCFTQTRNQLRQKLARFNSNEFSGLLLEILNESKRRYYNQSLVVNDSNGNGSKKNSLTRTNKQGGGNTKRDDILEEDDPLYDKVPSDEDYASVASESGSIFESTNGASNNKQTNNKQTKSTNGKLTEVDNSLTVSLNVSPNHNMTTPKFVSKEHKVLLTNFDKPQNYQQQQQSSLVANAESALNSIINSLNQIDYSHLNSNNQSQSTLHESSKLSADLNNILVENNNVCSAQQQSTTNKIVLNELKNENELMQAMIERLMEENAQLRAEKMLLATAAPLVAESAVAATGEINLYSTVKNKNNKFNNNFPFQPNNNNNNTNNKKQQLTNENELFYVPVQQLTKSPTISYNFKGENELNNEIINEQFNFEQQLKIVEDNHQSPSMKPYGKKTSSKLDAIKQQLLTSKLDNNNHSSKHNSPQPHAKLSPSKSMTNYYKLSPNGNKSSNNQNGSYKPTTPLKTSTSVNETTTTTTTTSPNKMPTKDSVIKKMKKITKAVQELFKATKESEFSLFKSLCEKVNYSVNEMIVLFPQPLNSQPIQENLQILIETSRNLIDLIKQYQAQIESFSSCEINQQLLIGVVNPTKQAPLATLSASSSSSSALSCGSGNDLQQTTSNLQQNNESSPMLKNMIVSNLVTYSYEIAYTVKRIVCIMGGAD